jgi:Ca2+-binding RTX toxin-like protein
MRRFSLASLAVAMLVAAIPPGAGAATQIGQTFEPVNTCTSDHTELQSTSPGGQYAAPTAGVITSWSFEADSIPPESLKFKVGRPAGGGAFTITGESGLVTPVAEQLNSYLIRIPVQAGDIIGLYSDGIGVCVRMDDAYSLHTVPGDVPPGTTETFGEVPGLQLDVSALLEPDCDQDGLGDETQDGNVPCGKVCKGEPVTIVGTEGIDELEGTPERDVISGLGGKDEISGLAGKDLICGGKGGDTLRGGKGKDKLYGQKGKDKLRGGGGKDRCIGGKKDDSAKKCEVEKSI